MEQTDLKIKDLLGKGNLLTFLIGSGCSVDAPSNVPDGNRIKEELIRYFCAESEIENILKIEGLKLDHLIAIIFESLGDNLEIFDYFELFDKPNLQHFFLADCIKKGHYLMSTNFDFLIEYALLELDIPKEEIMPIITEKEFINYSNPADLYKRGFKPIYKIHSSSRNIITGVETKSFLIDTIKELGLNRAGKSLFQIEPFKGILLDSICNGRSLVVMGYSGLNDFDILPTIRALKNLKNIIWINHSESTQPSNETIYEIKSASSQTPLDISNHLFRVVEKLYDIRRISNVSKIYLINANIRSMVKNLLQIKPKLSTETFSLSLGDWFKEKIKTPNMFEKVLIASRIYYELGFFDDAMKCSEIMTRFAILADVKSWKSIANEAITKSYLYQRKKPETLNLHADIERVISQVTALTMKSKSLTLIANINYSTENFPEAIKKFEEALEINEKLGSSKDVATCLNKIAEINFKYKKYNEALKNYNRALEIYKQLGDLSNKANSFKNIGECFQAKGDYLKAKKGYLSALKIYRELHLLKGKAKILNQLGEIMRLQKNYNQAIRYTMNAVKLNDELRDLTEKAISLKMIAFIKEEQKNYPEAIKFYNKAIQIYEKLEILSETANTFISISNVHKIQGNYSKALTQNERALEFYRQIGDSNGITLCLFDIASINFSRANYQEALKYYEELLYLNRELTNLKQRSIALKNTGIIYQVQGNFSKALNRFVEAVKIDEELENLNGQALSYYRIAMINIDQKTYAAALFYLGKALLLYEQLADLKGVALCLNSKGDLFRKSANSKGDLFQKYYAEALNQYKLSLRLSEELGDSSMKAECLINIGEVYKGQAKFSEASKVYNEALSINKELNDSRVEAICLNSIGDIYRLQGDYPKALEYCRNALKINEEDQDLSVKAKCFRNIALINQDQGNYSEALKNYKETLLIYKNYDIFEDSEIGYIEEKIKKIFSAKGSTEKALKYYEEALKDAEESDDLYKKLKIIDATGEIYQTKELYEEAVKNYEEALEIARLLEDKSYKFKLVSKIRDLYKKIFNKQ
jgi:tetratricopeptide (TPR) repeat protein